ncbi:uncharacterized protein LOC119382765 [Rhipicephalus sanguineus]|uniref:uncharacterized protein LOC119382765 n=1 Tax=Rhipicephalus sanguineus TaxID=34632 RepID=UPI0018962AFD|nr:uncharacterized protein LOC119382765 [Rhipicephalus sanguineus]
MTTHEPSFHTTKDKQNSLVYKNEPDTAATTEHNESDVAGIAKVAQLGHATMRNVTTDAVTSVSCLEYMERKVGRTDQLNSIVKDKKRDTNSVTHVDKDAAGVSDVTKHFATQTTATISASESDDEDRASVALENSDSSEQGILKQPNKLKQLKTTTLPEDVVQDKHITGHLEESCSDFTSHIIEGAATDQLKLQECDKSEVENKQKDKKIRQLNESDTPVMQAHDAATPEKPVTTTSENDNCEVTGFDKVQKARKSSGEPNVRKPENESASTSYDRCKVVSKSSLPRATENIQPEKSDHTNAKNKKQEPELNSHDAPTGRKQCRRAEGRDVKTKLSLSYLIEKMAKNYSEYPADDSNKGEKLESKQEPFSVLQYATMPAANKSDAESENDVQKNIAVVSCAEKGHKIWKKALDDEWGPDAGDKSDKLDDRQRPTSLSQNAAVLVMSNKSDASAVTGLHEGHKTCKEPLTDKTLADVGNKSNIKGDNRQRPASVWQHTTASKLGKKSTTDENDVQKDVTVVCTDDKGHKVCKTPQTDKCHADTGSTDKPNRQRPASLNKGVDKSENNVHRNAAVVSRPHKMCKKPFTDKCPIDVDNKSKKLKNGQTASISQHTTMSTPKPADDKRGNNVQENAKTAVEAHKGCNIHKEPPQQSLDIDKKDSNITEAVTKSIIEKDDIGNAATACEKRKEQKKIHEKRQVRQSDGKNKSGQAMASERCMVSTSNTRMDFAPHSAARKKSIETAGKDEMGCSMMIGPAADIVHTRTRTKKDAKGSETPGQAAIAYPTQHISKDAVASPAGLEELKNTGKVLQEDTTGSDTNTKMMVSKSFAEGSKKATTATAESQWERKLRGRTVTGCPTTRVKVSAAKATQEAAATKCYDNTEAISDKENSKHPCSPPREYAAHTKLGDNALSKDCFKTPKSVKSVELICPQTPLKCRSLRQKNLRTPVLGNGDALLDEQQSDPETPLGFKAKCTKQLAKRPLGVKKEFRARYKICTVNITNKFKERARHGWRLRLKMKKDNRMIREV